MWRNRNKKRFIPEGAVVEADGSWFYKYTEEDKSKMIPWINNLGIGPYPTGTGELVMKKPEK